jgi:hypothetical protein
MGVVKTNLITPPGIEPGISTTSGDVLMIVLILYPFQFF